MSERRAMPHDLDAERSVLSCALRDPATLDVTRPILGADDDWYQPAHRVVWGALCSLHDLRHEIAPSTVLGALSATERTEAAGGADYIRDLWNYVGTTASAVAEARIVAGLGLRRRQLKALTALYEAGLDAAISGEDYAAQIQAAALDLTRTSQAAEIKHIKACIKKALRRAEQRAAGEALGIPVPFVDLAEILGSFEPGDTYVFGGRPKMGKTALVTDILGRLAEAGHPGLLISLEMDDEQNGLRVLTQSSRVGLKAIRTGSMDQTAWPVLTDAARRASAWPFEVVDKPRITIGEIVSICRRRALSGRLDVIAVDYIGLVRGELRYGRQTNREQEMAGISSALKALAGELHVPILVVSQLSREVERRSLKDRRPVVSDLRETGSLEQDAAAVVLLYRDEVYNPDTEDKGICEVTVGVHRHGPTGTARLRWHGESTRFSPMDDRR